MKIMNKESSGRKTDERKNKTGRLYMQSVYLRPKTFLNFIFLTSLLTDACKLPDKAEKTEQAQFYMETALLLQEITLS